MLCPNLVSLTSKYCCAQVHLEEYCLGSSQCSTPQKLTGLPLMGVPLRATFSPSGSTLRRHSPSATCVLACAPLIPLRNRCDSSTTIEVQTGSKNSGNWITYGRGAVLCPSSRCSMSC